MPATIAFNHLERIRHRLPQVAHHDIRPQHIDNILTLAEQFDTYLFDAFGVLNVGNQAIEHSVAHIDALRQMGKNLIVLSNAATYGKPMMVEKFKRLGFDFSATEIITSRDALLEGLAKFPNNIRWGVIGTKEGQEDLQAAGIEYQFDDAAEFHASDAFLFLSSIHWDSDKQEKFVAALEKQPRTVLLGNPDLIAPMGNHSSTEPGSYVLLLPENLFKHCHVFGKPYPAIYALISKRLEALGKDFNPQRTLMCGDTLHTDILGGNAFDISTALISAHGFFKGLDPLPYIAQSKIVPDFILPQL